MTSMLKVFMANLYDLYDINNQSFKRECMDKAVDLYKKGYRDAFSVYMIFNEKNKYKRSKLKQIRKSIMQFDNKIRLNLSKDVNIDPYTYDLYDDILDINDENDVTYLSDDYNCQLKKELNNYNIYTIDINPGIERLGAYSFEKSRISQIVIPDTVTLLGNRCFADCSNLMEIKLPSELKCIGESAFEGNISLSKLSLNNGLTKLCAKCFKNCTSLTKIYLPDTLIEVDNLIFENCSRLPYLVFEKDVKSIPVDIIKGCDILIQVLFSSRTSLKLNDSDEMNKLASKFKSYKDDKELSDDCEVLWYESDKLFEKLELDP